jgi:hypothetical protein
MVAGDGMSLGPCRAINASTAVVIGSSFSGDGGGSTVVPRTTVGPVVVFPVVVPLAAAPAAASAHPTASAFCFARLLAMRSRSLIFSASRFASVLFARLRALRLRALALRRSMMVAPMTWYDNVEEGMRRGRDELLVFP